jgi:hypothetical protein
VNRLGVILGAVGLALLVAAFVIYRNARPAPAAVAAPPPAAASRPETAPPPSTPPPVEPPATPAPDRTPARRAPAAKSSPALPAPAPAAAVPDTATLTVVSDVPGAQVFLDRRFVGAAPATAAGVPPGSHQLNVSAPGFDAHVETIEVMAGAREIAVRFREVRLNAAIEVVHRHRIGSCRGRLVATPQGLRYETSDKNDAFTAALPELEAFQVDYLAKNLRIQPRRGRRFDFTDPDGNADRLFVFHRDVERARERLKRGEG